MSSTTIQSPSVVIQHAQHAANQAAQQVAQVAAKALEGPRWLYALLSATVVMNMLDAIMTIVVVHTGIAEEANPVMNVMLQKSPVFFAMMKFAMVSLGVLVLWRNHKRPLAVVGSIFVFAVYSALMAYHMVGVHTLAVYGPAF